MINYCQHHYDFKIVILVFSVPTLENHYRSKHFTSKITAKFQY